MVTIDGHNFDRVCAVTINAAYVTGSPTGFPLVIPREKLPDEMFDSDGSYCSQSDGRDVRVGTNSDGTGQIAAFVEEWSIATDPSTVTKASIRCAFNPTDVADSTLYLFYKSATATMPAVDSTYGQEAVFDANVLTSLPMSETSGNVLDRTANGNDGTNSGSTTTTGKVGAGRDFDGGNDSITLGSLLASPLTACTIECLLNTDDWARSAIVIASDAGGGSGVSGLLMRDTGTAEVWVTNGGTTHQSLVVSGEWNSTNYPSGTWRHVTGTWDGSNLRFFRDGVQQGSVAQTVPNAGSSYLTSIGRLGLATAGTWWLNGKVDEVTVHNVARSADWIATRSTMLLDSGNFFTLGTPEDAGGGGGGPVLPLIQYYNKLLSN